MAARLGPEQGLVFKPLAMRARQTLSIATLLPEGLCCTGYSLLTADSLALLDAATCLGPAQPLSAPILSGSPDPAWARPSFLSP